MMKNKKQTIEDLIEKQEKVIEKSEYVKAIMQQMNDNFTDIQRFSEKANADLTVDNLRWMQYEFDRINERTETFFNLSMKFLNQMEKLTQHTLEGLVFMEKPEQQYLLRDINEPINAFDRSLLTQLCNAANEKGFTVLDMHQYVNKYGQDKEYVKEVLNKLEYHRLIDCNPSLDGNVYSIQIFNFSEDMREPLNQ